MAGWLGQIKNAEPLSLKISADILACHWWWSVVKPNPCYSNTPAGPVLCTFTKYLNELVTSYHVRLKVKFGYSRLNHSQVIRSFTSLQIIWTNRLCPFVLCNKKQEAHQLLGPEKNLLTWNATRLNLPLPLNTNKFLTKYYFWRSTKR